MKKILKGLGILLLTAVVGFVLVVGPWPVDYTPIEKTQACRFTRDSIDQSLGPPAGSGKPEVGFGVTVIDLPKGLPLAGYGARKGASSTGTHDPIRAKAVAFRRGSETALMVGGDFLLINENLAARFRRDFRSPGSYDVLYFFATHTHSGPGGWGTWWAENLIAGDPSDEGVRAIVAGMVKAAETALARLEEATVSYGETQVPEHVRNRLLGKETPVDASLKVVRFTGRGGKFLGAIVSYAAHATVLGSDNLRFSAEYPGALERRLEAVWGGPVVFCAGPVGSMSPRGGKGNDFEKVESIGGSLASRAETLASEGGLHSVTGPVTTVFRKIPILTPRVQYRVSRNLRLSPILCRLVLDFNRAVSIQVIRLGSLVFLGLPCELSGEIATEIYAHAAQKGLKVILTPFNGHYVGYVVPDKYFPMNRYETRDMRFLGPHAGAFFQDSLKHIVDKLATL